MPITKKCTVTGRNFIVRDEDLTFYGRISPVFNGKKYQMPAPTISPEERTRRRLAFRNERNLYKRTSSLSGKEIISNIHPAQPYAVFSKEEWWSDNWDALDYGIDYDPEKSFFRQFNELLIKVPKAPLTNNKSENCDFCNYSDWNKNCYLITSANYNEDCYYGFLMVKCKNAVDVLWCTDSELLYECLDCSGSYNLKYSQNCENCSESAFLLNCRNVKNCLFCMDLRGKEYHVFNKPVTKEQFDQEVKALKGSYKNFKAALDKFEKMKKTSPFNRAAIISNSENIIGDYIYHCKNIFHGFDVYNSQDLAYVHDGLNAKDCMDIEYFDGCELCYESTSLMGYGNMFTTFCRDSFNLLYCDNCHGCKNCFGCAGLRKKQFCIFNKQYNQEEYAKQVSKIIEYMGKTGEWGEFYPISMSPFYYNDTLAHDYMPLQKHVALTRGYKWRDPDQRDYKPGIDVPDSINEVSNSICNEILACENCKRNYRLIPQEISFYKKMQIPVPHKCFNCRNLGRMQKRNSRDLTATKCAACGVNIITTSKIPNVYCEKCYLAAVY